MGGHGLPGSGETWGSSWPAGGGGYLAATRGSESNTVRIPSQAAGQSNDAGASW